MSTTIENVKFHINYCNAICYCYLFEILNYFNFEDAELVDKFYEIIECSVDYITINLSDYFKNSNNRITYHNMDITNDIDDIIYKNKELSVLEIKDLLYITNTQDDIMLLKVIDLKPILKYFVHSIKNNYKKDYESLLKGFLEFFDKYNY